MITKQHYIAEIEFPTTNKDGEDVIYTIAVTEYYRQEPDGNADSDIDYYGYTDIEYDLIGEDGKVIPPADYYDLGEEIEEAVEEHFEEEARESCYD